ncbi:MAG: hypothetical protein U5J64_05505 [Halobacteriales archaeon]|nr:hypothetical protein [Halobacteriales archaeon]
MRKKLHDGDVYSLHRPRAVESEHYVAECAEPLVRTLYFVRREFETRVEPSDGVLQEDADEVVLRVVVVEQERLAFVRFLRYLTRRQVSVAVLRKCPPNRPRHLLAGFLRNLLFTATHRLPPTK